MKIIEQGEKIDLSIRFICDVCGCVFEADCNEYEYNQCPNNYMTRDEVLTSTCPNCHCKTSHYSGTVGDVCDTFASLRTEFINKSKPVEF